MKKAAAILLVLAVLVAAGCAYILYYGMPWEEEEVPGELSSLLFRVEQLAKDCEAVTGWYFNYNKKVEDLSREVSVWEGKLGAAAENLSEVKENLSKLKEHLGNQVAVQKQAAEDRIGVLKQKMEAGVAGVAGKTDKLSGDVKKIFGDLGGVKAGMASLADELKELKSQMHPLRAQLDKIAGRLQDLIRKESRTEKQEPELDSGT